MLADTLEYESTLAAIARLAVPGVADWCAVDLDGDGTGELERVAVAHVDPAKVTLASEIAERYPSDPRADRGVHHVLRTGESQLWPDIPDALIVEAAQDDEHLRLIRTLGMTSAMMVPMRVRDRVLGVISFVSAESGPALRPTPTCGSPRISRCAPPRRSRTPASTAPRTKIAQTLQASLLPPVLPGDPRRRGGRAVPRRGRRARGRRRLLRPLRDDRGPLVRGDRRRLRQGRRGGGGDRAGPLHDPRRRGAARSPARDPALGQRGDAARGHHALLHDRRGPPRPLARLRRG